MATPSSISKRAVRHTIHAAALRLFADASRDRITLKHLAEAAGVPPGTVVTNVSSGDVLLEALAADILADHYDRVCEALPSACDPADKMAGLIRTTVRRGAVQPTFGRFISSHANTPAVIEIAGGDRLRNELESGLSSGRFLLERDQLSSVVATILGVQAGALNLVHFGVDTWERAGSDAAEFTLCALGILRSEARAIAARDLPDIGVPDVGPACRRH